MVLPEDVYHNPQPFLGGGERREEEKLPWQLGAGDFAAGTVSLAVISQPECNPRDLLAVPATLLSSVAVPQLLGHHDAICAEGGDMLSGAVGGTPSWEAKQYPGTLGTL
jgi:hypothetical protein